MLKLEDGVTLELGRFEPRTGATDKDVASGETHTDAEQHQGEDVHAKARNRFTHFNFRKRNHGRAAAGPALAVLDAEGPAHAAEGEDGGKDGNSKAEEPDVGVKVIIRLAALDEDGKESASINEQVTYLHVVRFGPPPPEVDGQPVDDKRPWVVKVVKREAIVSTPSYRCSHTPFNAIVRLARTLSTYTRYTVYLPIRRPPLTPSLLRRRALTNTSTHLCPPLSTPTKTSRLRSAFCACPRRVRLCYSHAGT